MSFWAGFEVAVDANEKQRRKEDNEVEIRKESLLKKLSVDLPQHQLLESLPTLVDDILSNEGNLQLEATMKLGRLLSTETSPPIEEVTKSKVVRRFVEFLMRDDFPQLQVEAAQVLAKIASDTSENTRVVIDNGAVPNFVKLLSSPIHEVREQAVRALGNVAGDSSIYRDIALGHEALSPLLTLLNEDIKLSMQRNATKALLNFCKGKPQPVFEQVSPALPVLKDLLHRSNDEEVLIDAMWALSYLSNGSNEKIQAVIDSGVCRRLVELLRHESPLVVMPALRTVENLVTGDHCQTLVWNLFTGNLVTGDHPQTHAVVEAVVEARLLDPLVNLLRTAELDIKEAALAILNALLYKAFVRSSCLP